MSGNEENQEEAVFKVTDRRKFNADGSLRAGVDLSAAEPPKAETKPTETREYHESDIPAHVVGDEEINNSLNADEDENDDIPGADDPASFVNFLSTLATNAAASLGAVPHPATGQRSLDLDSGKYWLDVLAMLRDKTDGNLHPKEMRLLDGLLADLRMQYVTMVRATEEKLKEQAAQKFSGADILGKKH